MDSIVPETPQSDEDGFLVAPSVFRADHKTRLQMIENNAGVSTVVGFVVYKSTELNRSQYESLSTY